MSTNGQRSANNGPYQFTADERAIMERMKVRMKDFDHINFQTDDMFLSKYLRAFDWDIEKSLEVMQKIYTIRKNHPDWFASKPVSEYMDLLRQKQRYILANRDRLGRRIFVYKMGNTRPETAVTDTAQLDDMWYECILTEHETQLNGVLVIIDCAHMPWCCLKWVQPNLLRIGAEKSDLMPLKHLEIHIVNQSSLMHTITNAVRPFLSKPLLKRFRFHKKGCGTMPDAVGREHLPEEYGGPPGQQVDYEYGYAYLKQFEEYLVNNRQYGIKS